MATTLPRDLSALPPEELDEAKEERDNRLAPLFRRWPELTKRELADLHRLWDERLRLAKHSGGRRQFSAASERSA